MHRRFRWSHLSVRIVHFLLLTVAAFLFVWILALTGCSVQGNSNQAQQPNRVESQPKLTVLRVGHQSGTPGLNLLKAQGTLEKRLASQDITVKWTEFKGGPPMMEAMAAGSIDIGNVGNLPPVFAQAGGIPIVYVAATNSNAGAQAIVVRNDSPIKSLADLKGKKVAIQRGTALHYLVLKALEKVGLTLNDIQPVNLTIPESLVAFEGGRIDALPTGDPFYAQKERTKEVRVLVNGADVAPQRAFYVATHSFADKYPDLVKVILEEQQKAEELAKANRSKVAKFLAEQTKYNPVDWEWALEKRPYFGVFNMNDQFIAEQQQVADLFYSQKLIPKPIQVKEAVWTPKP